MIDGFSGSIASPFHMPTVLTVSPRSLGEDGGRGRKAQVWPPSVLRANGVGIGASAPEPRLPKPNVERIFGFLRSIATNCPLRLPRVVQLSPALLVLYNPFGQPA